MESEDIAWADTRAGAANFNGKCNTNGDSVHYTPVTVMHPLQYHIDTLELYQYITTYPNDSVCGQL